MKKPFQDIHVLNLPDAFRKDKNSNNYKLLEIEKLSADELRKNLNAVDEILDFEKATGKTLDYYGERVGQPRGSATDAQYLMMIKGKIMLNRVNGSYGSISEALCFMLDCKPDEINIEDDSDPRTVNVNKVPLNTIVKSGMSVNQMLALVQRLLPVNVILKQFLFDGTFEFSGGYDDTAVDGATKGFTGEYGKTMHDDAIGGYLGAANSSDNEAVLPI